MATAGDAPKGSVAQLVITASEPWNPDSQKLFPAAARAWAVELLLLGHRLSREDRFAGEEMSLADVWVEWVMPYLVERV